MGEWRLMGLSCSSPRHNVYRSWIL